MISRQGFFGPAGAPRTWFEIIWITRLEVSSLNFLAHTYLSGENESVAIGNFIGDWVKGGGFRKYPPEIQKGILLHRCIDSYTDHHPTFKKSKQRLTVEFKKYSGIVIDIFYDHFLARDWNLFSPVSLEEFADKLRGALARHRYLLTPEMTEFTVHFMNHRRMESYATLEGMEGVLHAMARRTSLPDKTDHAIDNLKTHYDDYGNEFCDYFAHLIGYIEDRFQISINGNHRSKVPLSTFLRKDHSALQIDF